MAALVAVQSAAQALTIDTYTAAANDRFANNPSFIANGFNLSGVSRASNGAWVTMISPNIYIGCYHYTPATGNTVTFYQTNNPSGPSITRTISATRQRIGTTDLFVGTLDAPLPENYTFYARATEPLASTANWNQYPYKLASLYHVGLSPGTYAGAQDFAVGRNKPDTWQSNLNYGNSTTTIFVTTNNTVSDTNFVPYETMAHTGDSGAPILFDQGNGTLRLAGIAWVILSSPLGTGFSAVGSYASLISTFESTNTQPYQPLSPAFFEGARISASQIDLVWNDSSALETGYEIERASTDAGPWSSVGSTGSNATAFSDLSAPDGDVYYRIRAVNGATAGEWLTLAMALPAAPAELTAAADSQSVVLTWNALAAADSFSLDRSTLGTLGPWTLVSDAIPGNATSFTDSDLTANATVWYRLRAANAIGTGPWSAIASATTTISTDLVSDPFTDGSVTDGTDPLDVAWLKTGNIHSVVTDTALDPASPSNVSQFSISAVNKDEYIFFNLPGGNQTLAVGESLKLSFKLRHTGTPRTDNSATGFCIAYTPNNSPWSNAGNREYAVRPSYGSSANSTFIAKTSGLQILNSSTETLAGNLAGINAGTNAFAAWMEVARTGESTVVIRYQLGDGTIQQATDTGAASSIITTFNRVFFRFRTLVAEASPAFLIDDVVVTKSVAGTPAASQHPIVLWRDDYFGTTANAGDAADAFDFDGDGLPNLLEYALGGDPLQSGTGILPVIGTGSDHLTLGFTPAETAGLRYLIEASSDLSDWSDASDISAILTVGQPYLHSDPVNLGTVTRRFLRLRVETAP